MNTSLAITPQQSQAWLAMANTKNELVAKLSEQELKAQSILINAGETYEAIDVALAAYRKINAEMIETRKPFTNAIDHGIVQPLMLFEKRVKDNPDYASLLAKSLELRKKEKADIEKINASTSEKTRFKTFVENEYFRIVAEYRNQIREEFNNFYALMLQGNVKKPNVGKCKLLLKEIKFPDFQKFNTEILSKEEMGKIFGEVRPANRQEIYNELMGELDTLFANYDSDLANAEAAIAHNKEQQNLKKIEDEKKLNEEVAMNTLIATSEVVEIDEPKIKKTLQITVIESEAWAKSVIGNFVVALPNLTKYIRVKSWSKLNIGQMATYLGQYATETGITFNNLELEEIEK